MFDSLQSQLGKLLGRRDEDPQSTITADQLKVVLKSIEGKYNNLKNENKLFKSKIDEQKSIIGELEKSVSELKDGGAPPADGGVLSRLENDLDASQRQLTELREQLDGLRTEKLQLQSKLSVQEALVSSLRHEMGDLREGQVGGTSPEEHARALAELERQKVDNQALQSKLQDLARQLVEAEEGLDAVTALEGDLVRTREDLARREADIVDARAARQTLESDLARLRADAETSHAELGNLQSSVRKLEAERDALLQRLEVLLEEGDRLREGNLALVSERDALLASAAGLAEAREILAGERDRLAAALETQASEVADAREQLVRSEEALAALQMDKDELRHQAQKQQAEFTRLEEQFLNGEAQSGLVGELESRLMDARARAEQLHAENLVLQKRLQEVLAEPANLGPREKTELEFQIKRLSDELREAGHQIASLREAKVKANLDLEEAAGELVELRRQLDDLRRDRNFYRERSEVVRESQSEVDHLKMQMRDLVQEVGRLRGTPVSLPTPPGPAPGQPGAAPQAARPPDAEAGPKDASASYLARRREMLNRLIGDSKNP